MLTTADLTAALEDERHLGFGYATRTGLNFCDALDAAVVTEANALGWTAEDLFHWSNSKNGRWLVDHASGWNGSPAELTTVVRQYVNAGALEEALA